ncbi:MAG: hypothetical protein EZS28_008447 [Streblomastix strix]|uniref:Uncharacterized protein n=1 Tax=Streblomastix strix TaxID=222440 RepID=A0A5J4WML5_9EUKA|nr:MAG: hypothetical protein EZS28_008447 [Streblomastix strix]
MSLIELSQCTRAKSILRRQWSSWAGSGTIEQQQCKRQHPEGGSVEIARTSDGTSQEKETYMNKGLDIGNWRDPIRKNTIQTRHASHQVALKVEGQGSSQQRLEQVDTNQQERDIRHKVVDQQTDASSSGQGAILIKENQENVFAHGEWKDNNLKSSNQREVTAVLKALLEFRQELIQQQPIGIRLLTDNTDTMHCLNQSKGSIMVAPLVDEVLNLADQFN